MSIALIQTIWTVVAFLFFIGVVVWAWSSRRKKEFDKAAHIALDDDKPLATPDKNLAEKKQE